jgi:hypothetical protein
MRREGKTRLVAKGGKIRKVARRPMRVAVALPVRPSFKFVCVCIGCGCDDNNACLSIGEEPCHWVCVNRTTKRGICSECAITMFNAILFPEPTDIEIHRSIMEEVRR